MADVDTKLKAAVAYLRGYGGRYSVEALVERLRQEGFDQEVLDEAVYIHNQWRKDTLRSSMKTWHRVLGWALGLLALAVVLGVLLIGVCLTR